MGSARRSGITEAPCTPGVSRLVDPLLRLGFFIAVLVVLLLRFDGRSPEAVSLPLVVVGLGVGGYLLIATPGMSAFVRNQAQNYPLVVGLGVLLLALPATVLTPVQTESDPADLIFAAMLLLLPVGCAVLNTPELRRGDIGLGLSTAALPVLLPLTRNTAGSPLALMLEPGEIALRAGALALPAALLLFTTPRQKQNLNFLLLCATLSIWYSIEFGAFPDVQIDPAVNLNYFYLAAILTLLYALSAAGWLPNVGFHFHASFHELASALLSLAVFAVPALGIGLASGFLKPELQPFSVESLTRAGSVYLFVALPEEILFRGVLLRYLHSTLAVPAAPALLLSAVIFGAAHLNNPPGVGWYFVLATLAGIAYGWIFLSTGKVTLSALVHTSVNWVWWAGFSG
ncbi:MAG: type II CAAX endopeptidase family protein [Anaerolineae bacterium]|nr:type II CAAX endopeptidase family protein [Anaerolineae bacterium]